MQTPDEIKQQSDKDKKIGGFMKVAYSWISELFTGLTDKIVKVLTKDVYKIDAPQLDFLKNIKEIKGVDGEKGDKGDSPTEKELLSLIKPLIPEPIKGNDGKDADEEIIVKKVVPLVLNKIPKPKDGKDAKEVDEEKIISTITKKIPQPKNGKDGKSVSIKEVLDALKKGAIGTEHIRGLEQRLQTRQAMYGVGPSGALLGVAHDSTITGDGTADKPLKVVGGGAPTRETPTGDINGVNLTYTITAATTHLIYHNGVLLEEGAGNDYTISATTLTMLWAPESGKLSHVYWA